jgi:tRNA A37 N6-isopentenylltransferase MiaA
MVAKKPNIAGQLCYAKKKIANLEKENAELRTSWMEELTARAKQSRELELAYAQAIKYKGVIEYLEGKLKDE